MSELRYPNESERVSRCADLLLKDEQDLIDKVKRWQQNAEISLPGGS